MGDQPGGTVTCATWGCPRARPLRSQRFCGTGLGLLGRRPLPGPSWPDCRPPEDPCPRAQSRSREHEGAQAGGGLPVPGNSQHVCLSQYLDRKDLWVRFAILFSVRVINQLHAHSGCSAGLRRAHWHSHTHPEMRSGPCLMCPGRGRSSPGLFLAQEREKPGQPMAAWPLGSQNHPGSRTPGWETGCSCD